MISAAPPAGSFSRQAALFSFPAGGACALLIPQCQRIKKCIGSAGIALAAVLLTAQPCRSQDSVSDWGGWDGSSEISGFGIVSEGGGDITAGQTFQINDGNALVSNISVPIIDDSDSSSVEFQFGVAAWNGTQATGSVLYLSSALFASSTSFQTFAVAPDNLTLNQNQEYVLFLTANSFVNSSPQSSAGVGYVPGGAYTAGQYYSLAGDQLGINDLFTHSWAPSGSPADFAFEVDYQVVPEPGTLMLLGLGGVLLRRRHRI
jgi:hypothetical protein